MWTEFQGQGTNSHETDKEQMNTGYSGTRTLQSDHPSVTQHCSTRIMLPDCGCIAVGLVHCVGTAKRR